ncbi:MAG: hypothetical protein LBB78_08615 [Spirochaetaceae bacterium]|jgi:hypothetical protein|nr:hypothetical protein [Spirochaetaceae bacterium]
MIVVSFLFFLKGMRLVRQPGGLSRRSCNFPPVNLGFTGRKITVFLTEFIRKLRFPGNAVILLAGLLLFCTGGVFGETKPDVRGFNSGTFDYHFRRADREITPERWMAEARQGMVMARNAWELAATELYGDKVLLEEAGKTIEAWSEAELEKRFTEWLLRRFFSAGLTERIEGSAQEIRKSNLSLVYHLDENGKIRYDEETGDPLVLRPDEAGEYLEGDQKQWRKNAEEIINAGTIRYEAYLTSLFPELLGYVPEENREAFEEKLRGITLKAVSGRQKEFEALAAREERLFVAQRTGDVWSLRRKSEEAAAAMITAQLIEETEALCVRGIAALETRIEAAETDNGDLALAGSEWLDAYREQFEQGLQAWADAEERFFIRRIEWEQEAGQYYLEGEEAWSSAFNQFEQERRNWEAKAKTLFESGEAVFRRASENLEAAIAGAKAEFEQELLFRSETGAERARAWVDTYITCGSVVAGAQENINFWLKQYGKKNAPALAGGGFSSWISAELISHWQTVLNSYEGRYGAEGRMALVIKDIMAGKTNRSQEQNAIEELEKLGINLSASFKTALELKNWSDLYDSYIDKAKTARDALINDFNMVMGTGTLTDILAEGAVSEDFNLDEYQIELIRAKAVAGYWEKRKAIAQAVVAYAEELTAGRMTDSEGVKAWEQAKQSYDDALLRYETELSRLSAAGAGVKEAQGVLNNAAAALREAENKLEEKNQAYSILMSAYVSGRNDFILKELVSKYEELLRKYNLLTAEGDNAAYIRYLERAYELGFAQELETAGQMLKQLILGGEGIEKSLSSLMNRASNINVFEEYHIIPAVVEKFGLEEDDPFYAIIQALLSEKEEKLAGAAAADQGEIQGRYNKLISAMTKTAKAQAQVQLETRLKALDLLACNSTMDWYFNARGYEPEATDQAVFSDLGLEACLNRDVEKDARTLLKARLALELEGLSCFLGETEGGDRAKLLASFCLVNAADAAEILGTLKGLQLLLNSVEDRGSADYYAVLEEAALSQEIAAWFLNGGSCFVTQSGQVIAYGLLEAEMTAAARSQGLLAVYQAAGPQAAAAVREEGLRGLQGMGELFKSYGITLNDGYLPGMKSMGEALLGMTGPLTHNLSAFLSRMNGQVDSLPLWIRNEIQAWQASLITYIAAKTIYNNRSIAGSSEAIKNETEIVLAQFQAAQLAADALSYAEPGSARFLNAALRLPPELFTYINKTAIEDEVVKRIGRDLAKQYGAEIPESGLQEALTAACSVHHGYAEEGIRKRSVDEAVRLLLSGRLDDEVSGDSYYEIMTRELPLIFNTLASRQETLNFEYALVKAYEDINQRIKDAEGEGQSHWRQYLSAGFLEEYNNANNNEGVSPGVSGDPEGTYSGIKAAKNWREGILADAYEKAVQDTHRLNYAFRVFINAGEQPELEFIKAGIKRYQEDPLLEWDETLIKTVDYVFYDNYQMESGEFQKNFILEALLEKEIERLGMGYTASKQNSAGIKAEIKKISDEILNLQDTYDLAAAAYGNAAVDFAGAGAAYDEVYKAVKKDYADLEEARTAYETEDAIRRWASTAYLDNAPAAGEITADYKNPYEDLAYSKSRYERAVVALTALAGLYEEDERRPYADGEYEILYNNYRESFQRMILSIKTLGLLEESIAEELRANSAYYDNYNRYLSEMGCPINYPSNYQPPGDKSLWQLMDVLQIKNGKLTFSYDSSFLIQKMTGGQAAALKNFFTPRETAGIEVNMVSQFEAALRQLSQNMIRYEVTTNAAKYTQWGLARDYLLQQLIGNNPEIEAMADWYIPAKALNEGENLGEMSIKYAGLSKDVPVYPTAMMHRYRILMPAQKNAWDLLSDEEKADLEFYTILTLLGGGGMDSKGFSYVSAQAEYAFVNNMLNHERSRLKGLLWVPIARHLYRACLARLNATRDHLLPTYQQIIDTVEKARTGLETSAESLNSSLELYINSCNRLAQLNGTGTGNGTIGWNSIERALQTAGGITADEIQRLKKYWQQMEENSEGTYHDTVTALKELIRWSKNQKENDKRNFEQAWLEDEQARLKNEAAYREVFAAFVEGKTDINTLNKAAAAAYGNKAPARKNHLENLEQTIVQDLKGVTENGAAYKIEYIGLADELTELIKRAYTARYNAELTARELEWDMQRYDIQEKYRAWVEASGLILERGRADWNAGITNMQASYTRWTKQFNKEYKEIDEAWIAAYLAGLEDKARWVTMATEAANSTAAGALLAMVGSEAEMMSRRMDTRVLSGMTLSGGTEEAENTLRQLLQAAGIMNMETALSAVKGITGTIPGQVRRGMGGLNIWNSGTIQAAAAALAKEANEELAAREAKRVAAAVQMAVKEALDSLTKNVAQANEDFDETMDDVFIIEGQWRKNGRYYTKEAVVHSTLFDPVITERATVEGYEFYKMDPIKLSTDLSEGRIKDLDALAVQALINNMYTEVQGIAEKIFGAGEENPGLFTQHIGEGPAVKPDVNADMNIDELFSDGGTGQLGKLLRLYIYWAIKEKNGINMMNSALWEKPLWDSRDSWFQAPSIRSVVDIGNQVVSAVVSTVVGAVAGAFTGGAGFALGVALNTAMNLSDDLFFGVMDASGGFKNWDEVGVEFGKKAAITGAGSLIGGVFNGAGAAAGASSSFLQNGISGMITQNLTGLSKVITQTALTGLQSITTGTVTSALGAVTYNSQDGFGFSRDIFTGSIKGASIGALSGMTGSFTTGMMNWGLDGFYGQLHTDGAKLSSLAGGLAGQGVNYAFTGDYALNLFNMELLTAGRANSGLLELHLGRDGAAMGFGTGGVDVSAGTLTSSLRGLEAWKVNAEILTASEESARQYASQLRTLYSGDAVTRAEFEAALAGRTRYVENRYSEGTESLYDEYTGIKTVLLGQDALEEGSRFGLNVVFSHEAYRNGRNDDVYGQIIERNNAVAGHIAAAMGLMETYGTDSVGAALQGEAFWYNYALNQGEYAIIETALDAYDSGRDFWQLTGTGGLKYDGSGYLRDVDGLYINYDGTKTAEPVKEGPGKTVGASGIETGLLRILNLEPTKENITAVQNMMLKAGLEHTVDPADPENRDLWMWKGTTALAINNNKITIENDLLSKFGMAYLDKSGVYAVLVERALRTKEIARQESERDSVQPRMVDEELQTYCNVVFIETLKAVSNDNSLIKEINKAGIANEIGLYLQQEYMQLDSGLTAQILANIGMIVPISYINPGYDARRNNNNNYHGHIGTVVANYGTYIPALGPRISQGGAKNGEYWTRDPDTFGRVINNTSFYRVKKSMAKTKKY